MAGVTIVICAIGALGVLVWIAALVATVSYGLGQRDEARRNLKQLREAKD